MEQSISDKLLFKDKPIKRLGLVFGSNGVMKIGLDIIVDSRPSDKSESYLTGRLISVEKPPEYIGHQLCQPLWKSPHNSKIQIVGACDFVDDPQRFHIRNWQIHILEPNCHVWLIIQPGNHHVNLPEPLQLWKIE